MAGVIPEVGEILGLSLKKNVLNGNTVQNKSLKNNNQRFGGNRACVSIAAANSAGCSARSARPAGGRIERVTIDGYGEDWASPMSDDSKRPFKDYPKRVPLKGYSEEGNIFIEYCETAQNGIPFVYTEVGTYPQKYKLLEFSFGGRKKILQSQTGY